MSRTDWMTGEMLGPIPEMVMTASYLQEGGEHLVHGCHHAGIRAVSILQRDETRHFRIDIDSGRIRETLLQRGDDDVLALLEVRGRIRGLALLTHQLTDESR